jgi:hypothetical protein
LKSKFLRFLDLDTTILIDENRGRHHQMQTQNGFNPDDSLPLFLADEPWQQDVASPSDRAVVWSGVLKVSILVATATTIGIAALFVGNPMTLFANATASLMEKSALRPGDVQSRPTIHIAADAQPQSTADPQPQFTDDANGQSGADALAPMANVPTGGEIAAASEAAGQSQTENSDHAALFRQFQAWSAEQDAQAQLAEKARAPLQPVQKNLRPVQSAPAATRAVPNPRKKVRREQNGRVQGAPTQDSRAQDQSTQTAQAPSLLQILGFRN